MVIEQALAGPTGLFVKFSTLQQYGVDKVFFLENDNADASQRNVVFLSRGENAEKALAIAGKYEARSSRGSSLLVIVYYAFQRSCFDLYALTAQHL